MRTYSPASPEKESKSCSGGILLTALIVCALLMGVCRAATNESPAITLEGLSGFVKQFKGQKIPESMVIKLIEMYGLAFRPTSGDLEKLAASGATPSLIHAVEVARKPPLPPPPVVRQGGLSVACLPVDCEELLNGKTGASTE